MLPDPNEPLALPTLNDPDDPFDNEARAKALANSERSKLDDVELVRLGMTETFVAVGVEDDLVRKGDGEAVLF